MTWRINSIRAIPTLLSISTISTTKWRYRHFEKCLTNYDVDIDDIVHNLTISTSKSTYTDEAAKSKWRYWHRYRILKKPRPIMMSISTTSYTTWRYRHQYRHTLMKLHNQLYCRYWRYRTRNDNIDIDIDTSKFQD